AVVRLVPRADRDLQRHRFYGAARPRRAEIVEPEHELARVGLVRLRDRDPRIRRVGDRGCDRRKRGDQHDEESSDPHADPDDARRSRIWASPSSNWASWSRAPNGAITVNSYSTRPSPKKT